MKKTRKNVSNTFRSNLLIPCRKKDTEISRLFPAFCFLIQVILLILQKQEVFLFHASGGYQSLSARHWRLVFYTIHLSAYTLFRGRRILVFLQKKQPPFSNSYTISISLFLRENVLVRKNAMLSNYLISTRELHGRTFSYEKKSIDFDTLYSLKK